jgi:hypothetical protein
VAVGCVGVGLLLAQLILRPRRAAAVVVRPVDVESPDIADGVAAWPSQDAA